MSRVQLPVGCFVVTLVLACVLPATVDGSTFRKYKLGSYAKAKELSDSMGYRLAGKTTRGFQHYPGMLRLLRQPESSTTKESSPSAAMLSSLLGRLIHSSGRSSAGSERGAGAAEAFAPFLRGFPGNDLTSVTVNSATFSEGGDTGTADTGSSTASLLSLIRKVLDARRTSELTPPPSTEEANTQTSSAETAESRIRKMIMQLLGRQQPSETTDDDTPADSTTKKPSFDLMTLIRRLMGVKERPSETSETGGAVVEIPAPTPSHATLSALVRWMSRLDRAQTSTPNSPARFPSIIMKLLSGMASSRSSSTSTTSSPSAALRKWLSNSNKPGVSIRTSSTSLPTSLSTFLTQIQGQGSSSTTSSSTSSSLDKWLREIQSLRSSSRTSSTSSSLAKWLKAFEKSGASQGGRSITTSSSPLIRWLGAVQRSGEGSSARTATGSRDASLSKLLSAVQRSGSNVGWAASSTLK